MEGKFVQAAKYGQAEEVRERLELTPEEVTVSEDLRKTWADILKIDVSDETDFFVAGAGSMDVVRWGLRGPQRMLTRFVNTILLPIRIRVPRAGGRCNHYIYVVTSHRPRSMPCFL